MLQLTSHLLPDLCSIALIHSLPLLAGALGPGTTQCACGGEVAAQVVMRRLQLQLKTNSLAAAQVPGNAAAYSHLMTGEPSNVGFQICSFLFGV